MMGSSSSDSSESGWYQNEIPVHKVTLNPFLLAQTEITQKVWKNIMGNNPSVKEDGIDDNMPVNNVSWNDCSKFCSKTGLSLPSESQWEYACRAGSATKYWWGDKIDGSYAWYDGNSGKKLQKVKQKGSNAFGLYDMSGNVWEWCEDKWHSNYNGAPSDGSAWIKNGTSDRVFRGGVYWFGSGFLRSYYRDFISPGYRDVVLGGRLCCNFSR